MAIAVSKKASALALVLGTAEVQANMGSEGVETIDMNEPFPEEGLRVSLKKETSSREMSHDDLILMRR